MSDPSENFARNPYESHAELLIGAPSDPTVNTFEHVVNWQRFLTLLPPKANDVMDYGRGAGNFTFELAQKYPRAHIVGVDAAAPMLPQSSADGRVDFFQWNGLTPFPKPTSFDVITAKMVFHYMEVDELRAVAKNLAVLLKPNGYLAFSVPHPTDSEPLADPNHEYRTARYVRNIGATSVNAEMTHRPSWTKDFLLALPKDYAIVIDNVSNDIGQPKRMNILMCPDGKQLTKTFRRLNQGKTDKVPPRATAHITRLMTRELRSILSSTSE